MFSKGYLGGSYLVAIGTGVICAVGSGALGPLRLGAGAGLDSPAPLVIGILMGAVFVLIGVSLHRSGLADESTWRVARWGALGLGAPTFLVLILGLFFFPALSALAWESVATVAITGGGIVGVLVGTVRELHSEHERTRTLHQRNTVFLRLFRHDIRNSITVIQGHLELLDNGDRPPAESVALIEKHVDQIARLSDTARQLDELDLAGAVEPVDLAAVVREHLPEVRETYPDATLSADLAEEAWVAGNDLLVSVVDNLLRNAIEHNDGQATVAVTVENTEDGVGVLRVRDDGPGFPEGELDVHSTGSEFDLRHSDGVGLWLVRWIVDSYDGELSIENAPAGGAVVTVRLPGTAAPEAPEPHSRWG